MTEGDVSAVVNRCAAEVSADAPGTIAAINAGDPQFVDDTGDGLYSFVYDVNTIMVADGGNPLLVGMDLSGKTDAADMPSGTRS